MADTGLTEISATSQAIVAALVQKELIANAVIRQTVLDYTSWVKPGASSVKVPRAGSFSVQDKSENTATTTQALTFATDDISLNKYKHVPARIEDNAQDQAAVDLVGEYVQRMASAMAKQFDTDIYTQLKAVSTSSPDHWVAYATPSTLAKSDILDARELLDLQNVPDDGQRFLLVNPTQEADLLALDNFIDASKYGSDAPIKNGFIGRIYGFNVVKSTVCEQNTTLCYHRSHVAFAMQQQPKFERARASLVYLADELSLSMLYGVKVLDSGKRGVMIDATGT